jgi:flagellar biosynthesis/type III secretory pathway protein FliH
MFSIFFASKVLTSEEDQKFLERRREMIEDDLKDNWLYQNIAKEEREQGREQGLEQGLEAVRRGIEALAEARFSDLLAFVAERIASLTDLAKLQEILILVGTARTTDEIKQSLPALS